MKNKTIKPKTKSTSGRRSEKRGKSKLKEETPVESKSQQKWIIEDLPDEEAEAHEEDLNKDLSLNVNDYDYEEIGNNLVEEYEGNEQTEGLSLIESIQEISATKRRPVKRKEAAPNPEQFVAVKRRVNVGDGGVNRFLESIKGTGDEKTAEKIAKLQTVAEASKGTKRIKTLDAPAEKFESEKAKRTVLYENTKEEVGKWNSVVYHNRSADQLVFPMSEDKKAFKKPQTKSEFMPVTPLEEEIAKALYGEDYVARKKAEMTKDPEKTDMESYMLSVEEAMATHSELAKLRALQSYAMAKAKRQNKIKSKKYHRLLRKSKIKQQMKEFEELQKKDPEGAMLKLEELDKSRIQERMSLKHRNTGKWAKMQAARAKYDKDSRIALAEQLRISKDLTQKVQESSDEDDEDLELPPLVKSSVENPWMLKPSLQENEKLQMYYTGYKKFWDAYNEQMQKQKKEKESMDSEDSDANSNESDDNDDETEKSDQVKMTKKRLKSIRNRSKDGDADEIREVVTNDEEINMELGSRYHTSKEESKVENRSRKNSMTRNEEAKSRTHLEVNPDNFLKITKSGSSIAPEFNGENSKTMDLLSDSDDSVEENDQRMLIAEAFEDDDVVNEFHKEKDETIQNSKPQDIDNFLPGWGSWTGKGIVANPKKRQKFIKRAKKGPPRKDARASHVIINEEVTDKVRSHQVKEVPFPFTRVKDFEKSVRAPIGRTWLPEHAVKSLTTPKVITRLGSIIKPISEDVLVKAKETKFNVPNSIVRMAKVTTKK